MMLTLRLTSCACVQPSGSPNTTWQRIPLPSAPGPSYWYSRTPRAMQKWTTRPRILSKWKGLKGNARWSWRFSHSQETQEDGLDGQALRSLQEAWGAIRKPQHVQLLSFNKDGTPTKVMAMQIGPRRKGIAKGMNFAQIVCTEVKKHYASIHEK